MKLSPEIFRVSRSSMEPCKGRILVSEPCLSDAYFERSVVFLIEHNTVTGSMGLVLNKSSNLLLNSVVEGLAEVPEIPLFCGGPMENDHLFYLHTLGHLIPHSIELSDGFFIGGDLTAVMAYLKSGNNIDRHIKFFLGYSGWEPGQLDTELSECSWGIGNKVSPQMCIYGEGDLFWRNAVKSLGESYKSWLVYPKSPMLN